MTRERAKELLPIIQAFAEGKEIQMRVGDRNDKHWVSNSEPSFLENVGYRIKPEPREWFVSVRKEDEIICVGHPVIKDTPYVDSTDFQVVKVREVL